MKYIKLYEKKDPTPKVGDYVLLHNFDNECELYKTTHNVYLKDITNYICNTIGQIYKITDVPTYGQIYKITDVSTYYIKYENIPDNLKFWFSYDKENNIFYRSVTSINILHLSSDKDKLEKILLSKISQKYNL